MVILLQVEGNLNYLHLAGDETRIKRAIQYLHILPEFERRTLVRKIIDEIKITGQLSISKDNIIFKYISTPEAYGMFRLVYKDDNLIEGFNNITDYLDYQMSLYNLDKPSTQFLDKLFRNKDCFLILQSGDLFERTFKFYTNGKNESPSIHAMVIAIRIYLMINNIVINYFDDCEFNVQNHYLINSTLIDLLDEILGHSDSVERTDYIHIKDLFSKTKSCPKEFKYFIYLISLPQLKDVFNKEEIDELNMIYESKATNSSLISYINKDFGNNDAYVFSYLIKNGANVLNTLNHFRHKIENNPYMQDLKSDTKLMIYDESRLNHVYFGWIKDDLEAIKYGTKKGFFNNIKKEGLTNIVDQIDIFRLMNKRIIKSCIKIICTNMDGQPMYIGLIKKTAYIITKKLDNTGFVLLNIHDGKTNPVIFVMNEPKVKFMGRVIKFDEEKLDMEDMLTDLNMVTENFTLDKQANMKFEIPKFKRSTYMSEYNAIHTVLKHNHENKNYEGMKSELARLYALILIIEKEVVFNHTKKVSPSVKADATKARMFAKNDFKRYMGEVLKNQKDFDFTSYFLSSPYNAELEKTYKININMIGLKTAIKSIMV